MPDPLKLFTPEEREHLLETVYDYTCMLYDLMGDLDARRKGQSAYEVVSLDPEGLAVLEGLSEALDAARAALDARDATRAQA